MLVDALIIGAVVNASRSIMYAWKKEAISSVDYAISARNEVIRMRDDINSVR